MASVIFEDVVEACTTECGVEYDWDAAGCISRPNQLASAMSLLIAAFVRALHIAVDEDGAQTHSQFFQTQSEPPVVALLPPSRSPSSYGSTARL